jgi:hypothetical protein
VDFIFEDDRDRVNSQIGISIVPDHHLARLPDTVMSDIMPGFSSRKPFVVYIDPLPTSGRIVPDKDEVRSSLLFRAINTQVGAASIAKKPAFTIT